MAKHRTKDQKRQASEGRRLQSHTQDAAVVELMPPISARPFQSASQPTLQWTGGSKTPAAANAAKAQTFFGFDPKWVYQDLRKTGIVSVLIVGILVAITVLSR